jgi:hypothetical protein
MSVKKSNQIDIFYLISIIFDIFNQNDIFKWVWQWKGTEHIHSPLHKLVMNNTPISPCEPKSRT